MSNYFDHPLFDVLIKHAPSNTLFKAARHFQSGEILAYAKYDFACPDFDHRFMCEFFRKAQDLPMVSHSPRDVALANARAVEESNFDRLERLKVVFSSANPEIVSLISRIRKQVSILLGKAPLYTLEPRFTFGATSTLARGHNLFDRLSDMTCTQGCYDFLVKYHHIYPLEHTYCVYPPSDNHHYSDVTCYWPKGELAPQSVFAHYAHRFKFREAAVAETVPKTALTDRFIAKDQVVNLAYQAGVHTHIVDQFSRFGFDFESAQQRHRALVIGASFDRQLATIDLSSASDTLLLYLVQQLVPAGWYEIFSSLRSPRIKYPDEENSRELLMAATSGNGFNSALQTVIFMAIAMATTRNVYTSMPPDISVYGDDIIVPSTFFHSTIKVLKLFGFIPNQKKSFGPDDPVRESCGVEAIDGVNVRGLNVDKLPTRTVDYYTIINGVRRVCYIANSNSWRSIAYYNLWKGLIRLLPTNERLYGPDHYGDSVICTDQSYSRLWCVKNGRIRVYQSRKTGRVTFGTAFSNAKIPGRLASRVCGDPSFRGSGKTLVKTLDKAGHPIRLTRDDLPSWTPVGHILNFQHELDYKPSLLTKHVTSHDVYEKRWVPFTLYGQASSEVDTVFANLTTNVLDDSVIRVRRLTRRRDTLQRLADVLQRIVERRSAAIATMVDLETFEY